MEWVNKSYRIFLYYRLIVVLHRVSIDTMIVSFRDKETRRLWQSGKSRRLPADLQLRAFKKLAILNASVTFDNLKVPPGNQLEALRGKRAGQHSIRVNDQHRVCFVGRDGNAFEVEIVDYH
jgi:proteic killer suppression protein